MRTGERAAAGHRLRRASIDEFRAAPFGRYVAGDSFLFWASSPRLLGHILFGLTTEADSQSVVSLSVEMIERMQAPYDLIAHLGRMSPSVVNPRSFEIFESFLKKNLPRYARVLRRQAIVPPAGPMGAMITGLNPLYGAKHEWRICRDFADALDWIGTDEARELRGSLDALLDEELGESAMLRALRQALAADPSLRLSQTARRLGRTPRSVQRELARAATSYREEVSAARLQKATELILGTELKMEAVAREAGWKSMSQFSADFLKRVGARPSEIRARMTPPKG